MTPAQPKHLTPYALLPFACRNNARDERVGVLHYVNSTSHLEKFCPHCEALGGYPGCDKHILDTSEMCKPHAIRARHARRKETR
jgi:hypothetical protein